jgi:hypothetical protein
MRRVVGWGGRLPGPCRWRRRVLVPLAAKPPPPELARGPSADLPSLSGTAPLPLASDSGVAAVVLLGLVVDEGRKVIVFVIHQPLSASRWCLVVWQKGTCTTSEL